MHVCLLYNIFFNKSYKRCASASRHTDIANQHILLAIYERSKFGCNKNSKLPHIFGTRRAWSALVPPQMFSKQADATANRYCCCFFLLFISDFYCIFFVWIKVYVAIFSQFTLFFVRKLEIHKMLSVYPSACVCINIQTLIMKTAKVFDFFLLQFISDRNSNVSEIPNIMEKSQSEID